MSRYDVVVVGAGPAGSTAALSLARSGLRVALLERVPRGSVRACAGVVSPSALALVEELAPGLARAAIPLERLEVRLGRRQIRLDVNLALLPRDTLEEALVAAAVGAGAEFLEEQGVGSLSESPGGVRVLTSTGARLEGRYLVGADGGDSLVSARLGLGASRAPRALALAAGVPEPAELRLELFPGGFEARLGGWRALYLPRPPRAGVAWARAQALRRGWTPERLWPLPLGTPGRVLHSDSCLLVGDAAGLADPLTGMGLERALRSGLWAARAVAEGLATGASLAAYSRTLQEELDPWLSGALGLARLAYRWPLLALTLLGRRPRATAAALRGEIPWRRWGVPLSEKIKQDPGHNC